MSIKKTQGILSWWERGNLVNACGNLKVLIYGPGDVPICTTNVGQLGLCPTTLVKLEDYGLKIGDRISELYVSGQSKLIH